MVQWHRQMTIGEAMMAVAHEHARREALLWHDQRITYADLGARIEAVARHCVAAGLRKGDKVALLLPNRPEFIYAFMGIILFGGVVVPINPTYRRRELQDIINDAEARMVIAVPEVRGYALGSVLDGLRPALPGVQQYLFAGDPVPAWAQPFPAPPAGPVAPFVAPEPVTPDDLLGLIYTSGTTGRPKGVIYTHRMTHNIVVHAALHELRQRLTATPYPFAVAGGHGTLAAYALERMPDLADHGGIANGAERLLHALDGVQQRCLAQLAEHIEAAEDAAGLPRAPEPAAPA